MSLQKQVKPRAIDGTVHISAKPSKAVQTPLKPIGAHPTLSFTFFPAFPFSFSFEHSPALHINSLSSKLKKYCSRIALRHELTLCFQFYCYSSYFFLVHTVKPIQSHPSQDHPHLFNPIQISAKPSNPVQTPLNPIGAHPTLSFTLSPAFPFSFSFSFSFFLCTRDSATVVLLSNWSI